MSFSAVAKHLTIAANPETLQPGQSGSIEVTYDSKKINDWGNRIDAFYIIENGKLTKNESNKISIISHLRDDFSHLTAQEKASAPKADYSSYLVDFGAISKSDKIKEQTISISNKGKSSLSIHKIALPMEIQEKAPFKVTTPSNRLEPKESTQLKITFQPRYVRMGSFSQRFYVYTNDPDRSYAIVIVKAIVKE